MRQGYIPIRKRNLTAALLHRRGTATFDPVTFERFAGLLSAIIHHEYFAELEALRDGFAAFAPGSLEAEHASDGDYKALLGNMELVLKQANFEEISQEELAACDTETEGKSVRTNAPKWHYDSVRFFRRGQHAEIEERRGLVPLRKKRESLDVYDDVVVFVRFRKFDGIKRQRRMLPAGATPGSVLIKAFVNIPIRDICMLYPDLKIRMTRTDAVLLGAPALLGAIPILMNILPAISVVLVLGGALLGFQGAVSESQLKQALGALAILTGAGAFMFRQYSNYAFKKLKYQKRIADSLYFRNASNHAGVFETLIGAAEDQDVKEALLAYHFLLTEGAKTRENLDHEIEAWLKAELNADIDFEIGDALAKLERLKLISKSGPYLSATPLADALAHLDAHWDSLYDYVKPAHRN
jgi:hypothetical protein